MIYYWYLGTCFFEELEGHNWSSAKYWTIRCSFTSRYSQWHNRQYRKARWIETLLMFSITRNRTRPIETVNARVPGWRSFNNGTKQFFFEHFKHMIMDSSTFKVQLHRKPDGIHVGFQCKVLFDNVSEIYYVKTNHMGRSKAISPPDLREIFAYIILQEIKMGPECFIFSSIPGTSKTTIYIATKEIKQLTLMKNLKRTSPNIKVTRDTFTL